LPQRWRVAALVLRTFALAALATAALLSDAGIKVILYKGF